MHITTWAIIGILSVAVIALSAIAVALYVIDRPKKRQRRNYREGL